MTDLGINYPTDNDPITGTAWQTLVGAVETNTDDIASIDPGVSLTSDFPAQAKSGAYEYLLAGVNGSNWSTANLGSNLSNTVSAVYFQPVYLRAGVVVSGLVINVQTASDGDTEISLGLYANDGTDETPDSLLASVDVDATSTGQKIGFFGGGDFTTAYEGWYWVGAKGLTTTGTVNPEVRGATATPMNLPIRGLSSPVADLSSNNNVAKAVGYQITLNTSVNGSPRAEVPLPDDVESHSSSKGYKETQWYCALQIGATV